MQEGSNVNFKTIISFFFPSRNGYFANDITLTSLRKCQHPNDVMNEYYMRKTKMYNCCTVFQLHKYDAS